MTEKLSSFDQRTLRNVLGSFVTGVTVVTTRDNNGKAHGVTANSFSSVSLDPPLVLWSQSLTSKSYPAFSESDHFAVNILADDQIHLSNHFAKSQEDKFIDVACSNGLGGSPVLACVSAHLECKKIATYPGGDHVVYLGQVENIGQSNRVPLAFGHGKYMTAYAHDLGPVSLQLGSSSPAQLDAVNLVTQALPPLAETLGSHTLCLSVWGNHGPTAIHWEPSSKPVSNQLRLGLVMPITHSATGHAFAAFLPMENTKAFIEEGLRQFIRPGEEPAIQRANLEASLEQTRLHGLAQATHPDVSPLHKVAVNAFSAPIYDAQGQMLMALSITSPSTRLSPDITGQVPTALRAAADQFSQQIAALSK
ncbi:MAG: flavin reductase [Pseudomonadaceae bacterium]|nr:flavin reductase [Pseudomonadaceae bacterium]